MSEIYLFLCPMFSVSSEAGAVWTPFLPYGTFWGKSISSCKTKGLNRALERLGGGRRWLREALEKFLDIGDR